MLTDFEGYWQLQLNTVSPHGMNIRDELKEAFYRKKQ